MSPAFAANGAGWFAQRRVEPECLETPEQAKLPVCLRHPPQPQAVGGTQSGPAPGPGRR